MSSLTALGFQGLKILRNNNPSVTAGLLNSMKNYSNKRNYFTVSQAQGFIKNPGVTVSPVFTAHPCHPVSSNQPTVSDEVTRLHSVKTTIFNNAEMFLKTGQNIEFKNWVAKESDRNPNRPQIIFYGIFMDYLHGVKLALTQNPSKKSSNLLLKMEEKATLLKSLSQALAGRKILENQDRSDSESIKHYKKQFFENPIFGGNNPVTNAELYLTHKGWKNTSSVDLGKEFRSELMLLEELEKDYYNLISTNNVDQSLFDKHTLVPLHLADTQGRLPAEDVEAAMIDLLKHNHLLNSEKVYSDQELIAVMQQAYDSDFKFNCDNVGSSIADILEYYELYDLNITRQSEVVLANWTDAKQTVASMLFTKITKTHDHDRCIRPMALVEDFESANSFTTKMEDLLKWDTYRQYVKEYGFPCKIAMSDITRGEGIPAGRHTIAMWQDAVMTLQEKYHLQLDMQVGMGSSSHRGNFYNTAAEKLQFTLNFKENPKVNFAYTSQPGIGREVHFSKANLGNTIPSIVSLIESSSDRVQLANDFTTQYSQIVKDFLEPGRQSLQHELADPNSNINNFIQTGAKEKVEAVLAIKPGSRHKPTTVDSNYTFNSGRAITVFAITKAIGYPIHTIFPLSESIIEYKKNHSDLSEFKNLYETNLNFKKLIDEIIVCMDDYHLPTIESLNPNKVILDDFIRRYQTCKDSIEEITGKQLLSQTKTAYDARLEAEQSGKYNLWYMMTEYSNGVYA